MQLGIFGSLRNKFYSTRVALNLNSAQVAFSSRLGINQLPDSKLLIALTHPKVSNVELSEFESLRDIGNSSLQFFTKEYLKSRFPFLKEKYLCIGLETFLANKNILMLARSLGIEAACGLDILMSEKRRKLSPAASIKRRKHKFLANNSEVGELNMEEIQISCFKAILGLIGKEIGPTSLRQFLDSRYFNNSQFNPKDLIRPLYPIPDLTEIYPKLIFRLHQESGRYSSSSMFIVGVYSDGEAKTCLAEGYGASQALAQHRSATEALRKLFLAEQQVLKRPSDDINTIDLLLNFR